MTFFNILKRFKFTLFFVTLFIIIVDFLFAFVDPLATKMLIDKGIMMKNMRFFILLGIFIIIFGTFIRIFQYLIELLTQKTKNKILLETTITLFNYYYRIPYIEIIKNNSGYYLSRIYDESKTLCFSAIDLLFGIVGSSVIAITSFFIVLYITWKITLILLFIVPLLYFLSIKIGSKITLFSQMEKENEAVLRENILSSLSAYRVTKIFNLFNISFENLKKVINEFLNTLYLKTKKISSYNTASSILMSYTEFCVLIFLGLGVIIGILTIGGLFAYMNSFWKFFSSITRLIEHIPQLFSLKGSINRIKEYEKLIEGERKERIGEKISLNNISFSFNNKGIIKDFSYNFEKGQKYLIRGDNGSGKTTLLNIIAGFLYPEGEYSLLPMERISAMIMPDEFIPGDLKDNVNYKNLSEEKKKYFMRLVQEFGLTEHINKNPKDLSEGEKRKFFIIRTLLKDADLYLFDEPLNNLDVQSKEIVIRKIVELTEGKTLIVVMHGEEKFSGLFNKVITLKQKEV